MSFEVEYFTLTGVDATINKYVELAGNPATSYNVALDIISGTAQALHTDFSVDGTRVKWDGTHSLDGTMAAGDLLRVIYDRS
jgi:hypothetical protein